MAVQFMIPVPLLYLHVSTLISEVVICGILTADSWVHPLDIACGICDWWSGTEPENARVILLGNYHLRLLD